MIRALLLALGLVTGGALAQTQKPPADAQRPAETPSRPLNLKLDGRAGDYTREAPREEKGDNLPGLGDGAMAIDKIPTPRSEPARSPYPESR